VQKIVDDARANGSRIDYINGSEAGELRKALSADGLFFEQPKILIVASTPEKASLDLIKEHLELGNPEVTLLLHLGGNPDGRTKFGKFVNGLSDHLKYPVPEKPWEAVETAQKFCVDEAKRYGKALNPKLAPAFTDRVGIDLGRLSFEIQKMAMLADAEGKDEIDGNVANRTLAIIGEAEVQPVLKALEAKNRPILMRALRRLKDTTASGSPVMRASAVIEYWATKGLGVTELREKGVSPDDAALQLNQNPWYYKNKLMPSVAAWTKAEMVQLIRDMATSQRAVLTGQLDPWTGFLVRLLRICG